MIAIFTGAMLVFVASSASAQRSCKKGIPCGGSCIAATKVCRVGSTQPSEREASTRDEVVSPADVEYLAALKSERTGKPMFVGNVDTNVYYLAGCKPAKRLLREESVPFRTAAAAEGAGFRRSRARGC